LGGEQDSSTDCESVIYSRRHRLCGVCAAVLPDEILFDGAQAQNVSSLMREERQRHPSWLERFNFCELISAIDEGDLERLGLW